MTIAIQRSLLSEATIDGTCVLSFTGDFTVPSAGHVAKRMVTTLSRCKSDVVVDLRAMTFCDSDVLRLILLGCAYLRSRRYRLVLVRARPRVWRGFEIAGVDQSVPSFGSLDEALEDLATERI
jgi:anti-anti-sigma factor